MRIHYAFNVVTGDWLLTGSSLGSPGAVQEFCKAHGLEGFEPQSVDLVDAYFRPFKTAIDNRNNVTQVNYQAELEQAAKNQSVGLTAGAIVPGASEQTPDPADPNLAEAKAKMEAIRDATVTKGDTRKSPEQELAEREKLAKSAAAQEQIAAAAKVVEKEQKDGKLAQDPGKAEEPPAGETLQEKLARLRAAKK